MAVPLCNKPDRLLPVHNAKRGFNDFSAALSLALEIFSNSMIRISGEIYLSA